MDCIWGCRDLIFGSHTSPILTCKAGSDIGDDELHVVYYTTQRQQSIVS